MALSALAADLDGAAAAAEDPDEGSAEAVAAPATPAAAADAEPISDTIASQHGASVESEGRVALTYFLTLR